ncbi:MAG: response regulator transcription factor [Chloroflexi bacterium]|nr:response regulator transcription factor [Chloroflexota bacterium]
MQLAPLSNGVRLFVIERDVYARQAIVSYLSWDRRTRVVEKAASLEEFIHTVEDKQDFERLDAIILDTSLARSLTALETMIQALREISPDAELICLGQTADADAALIAAQAGASAYLLREDVGLGLAAAVQFVLWSPRFVVTQGISTFAGMAILPERRRYERLTQRIEQALWLCVVEGLPAELAAEEMGVSTSTVRSYIKEGYRILEAGDATPYPAAMSPVERAFLRFTALDFEGHHLEPAAA